MGDADSLPAVAVRIPGLLTRFTDGRSPVTVRAATVAGCVAALLDAYPALEPHLLDDGDELRSHIQLFHNGSTVSGLANAGDAVEAGDEVVLLQAVSGGAGRPT